ncbi:MAG: ATP-binding protein, partial [Planctomycetota bacterium]
LLLASTPAPGRIAIGTRGRALLFDSGSIYRLADELESTLGEAAARGVLARFGYQSGYTEATQLRELLDWDSEHEWLRASAQMLSLSGVGQVGFSELASDRARGLFRAEVRAQNAFEAEEFKNRFGPVATPRCHRLTGYLTGYVSACLGRAVFFVETECAAHSDDVDTCSFLGLPVEEWGERGPELRKLYEQDSIAARLEANDRQLLEQAVQLREQEAELAARRELEEASRLKSEFLANVSHELRTPLNAILGYVDLLLERIGPKLPPAPRSGLESVHENAQHLLSLINSILDASKLAAGDLQLFLEPTDPRPLIAEVLEDMRPLLEQRPVEFVQGPGLESLGCLRLDPVRFKQCLVNLVGNAAKFTASGTITIDAERLPVAGGPELVAIHVIDTGPGISRADQGAIFQPFRQADGSYTRSHGGTGLGLPIVRQLLAGMGGEVRLQSTPGAGSRFSLVLPAAPAPAAAPEPVAGQRRLLVIDDDPAFCELVRVWLSDETLPGLLRQLAVEYAQEAAHGVALARRTQPDAVLLDLRLPHSDGREVLHVLKSDVRTQHIPVVVMSAREDVNETLREGAFAALDKATDPGRLLPVLAACLQAEPASANFLRDQAPPSLCRVQLGDLEGCPR